VDDDDKPTDADRERHLLATLDGMDLVCWRTLVRWFAPQLAKENPKLLAEIVIRRGQANAVLRKQIAGGSFDVDEAEIIAQEFGEAGLRVVPCG
jgi:hypothetical protein